MMIVEVLVVPYSRWQWRRVATFGRHYERPEFWTCYEVGRVCLIPYAYGESWWRYTRPDR